MSTKFPWKLLANIGMFAIVTDILYKQLARMYMHMKRKSVNEVLLSNVSSGCCSERNYSKPNNCPSQYCVRKNIGRLIQLIDSSQNSICLAMYSFNCYELKTALRRAHNRRVQVKIVTTNSSMSQLSEDLMDLKIAGVAVRFSKYGLEKLLHHKFCLLDADKSTKVELSKPSELPKEGVLLTGSMNWTTTGFSTNWDNFVLTSNQKLVRCYQKEFNNMWKRLE